MQSKNKEQSYQKTCKSCGHSCHCDDADCKECVNDVCVRCTCQIPIQHYVEKLKEHEEKRLSFNERMKYWEQYKSRTK